MHHTPSRELGRPFRLLVAGMVMASLLVVTGGTGRAEAEPGSAWARGVRARYAILVDPATGAVLWGRRSRTPAPPASLTKMLTALAVRASLDLDAMTVASVRRPASRPAAWP